MRGYLGLGSNQGDRLGNLRRAASALERRGVRVRAASSVYETEPQGDVPDQPDFLNACLAVETELGPDELLDVCKGVEAELGRPPGGPRHAPRPLDVDLLAFDGVELRTPRLTLPHPEIRNRRFVIEPLLELAPELTLSDGTRLAEELPSVREQRVARVGRLHADWRRP